MGSVGKQTVGLVRFQIFITCFLKFHEHFSVYLKWNVLLELLAANFQRVLCDIYTIRKLN